MKAWQIGAIAAAFLLAAAVMGSATDGGDVFPLGIVFALSGWAWGWFGRSVRFGQGALAFFMSLLFVALSVLALAHYATLETIGPLEVSLVAYVIGLVLTFVWGLMQSVEESTKPDGVVAVK